MFPGTRLLFAEISWDLENAENGCDTSRSLVTRRQHYNHVEGGEMSIGSTFCLSLFRTYSANSQYTIGETGEDKLLAFSFLSPDVGQYITIATKLHS